jgi:DNA-directed RNA polymerase subunit L
MKKYDGPHAIFSLLTDRSFSPDVEFCAYSIPHPSENVMNIRIQTYSEPPPSPPSVPN